ncbi:MAG: hypothetical protein IT305_28855 [Chloroflexi bacterium]|nr:hypothetical protein [Chloroflexota bacterium]
MVRVRTPISQGALAFAIAASLVTASPAMPTAAEPEAAAHCEVGESPAFGEPFAELALRVGRTIGEPTECAYQEAGTGDLVQQTTTGRVYVRSSTGAPSYTDGAQHVALTPAGLAVWTGPETDPPESAVIRPLGTVAVAPPPGARRVQDNRTQLPGFGPAEFVHAVIEEPPSGTGWPCLQANPACGREPWWAQRNQLSDSHRVQFRYLGPGLVADYRFAEAVALLWQWPEGRQLVQQAANHGVEMVVTGDLPDTVYAAYQPSTRRLLLRSPFAAVPTWLQATVMAHELRHAFDHRSAKPVSSSSAACFGTEHAAFRTELRLARWLSDRFGGLPTPEQARSRLNDDAMGLYEELLMTAQANDEGKLDPAINATYDGQCGWRGPKPARGEW